jgi:hypothetical protein
MKRRAACTTFQQLFTNSLITKSLNNISRSLTTTTHARQKHTITTHTNTLLAPPVHNAPCIGVHTHTSDNTLAVTFAVIALAINFARAAVLAADAKEVEIDQECGAQQVDAVGLIGC